jgi:hypothetical protein
VSVCWVIEARKTEADSWEIVDAVFDTAAAGAMREILEGDGFQVRSSEVRDISSEKEEELFKRSRARSVDELDRWQDYRLRAAALLHERDA